MERKIFGVRKDRKTTLYIMLQLLLCASFALTSYAFVTFDTPKKGAADFFVSSLTRKPEESISALLGIGEKTLGSQYTEDELEEPPTYIDYGKRLDEILGGLPSTEEKKEIPEGCFGISAENISMQGELKKILFKNSSGRKLTAEYIESLADAEYPVKANVSADVPLVLIVHTHTTEAYLDEDAYYYNPKKAVAETRSHKDEENVIAVGKVVKDVLEGMGISVMHVTDYHDIYVFNESYNHSYSTVKKCLETYPSIKYVIDLHRDSVIHTNGTKVQPVAEIDGRRAAQVMFVVGLGTNGLVHDAWEKNLTLAVKLQERLVKEYPDLTRPLNLRSGRFNQHLSAGMLLWEMGSCGNTLEQAKYSARLVATEYGKLILENSLN